jgi:excisionase family DNA binding protein
MYTGATEPLAYRVSQFARLANISLSTTKRLIYSGELRSRKIGRVVLIPADAAKEFLAGKTEEARNQESLPATA